jgi:hypothetical protein
MEMQEVRKITEKKEGSIKMAMVKQSTDPLYIDANLAKQMFLDGKTTFYHKVEGIRQEIQNGRYADYAVLDDGKTKVCKSVYVDFSTYRTRLQDTNMRKHVPPFNERKIVPYTTVDKEVVIYGEGCLV